MLRTIVALWAFTCFIGLSWPRQSLASVASADEAIHSYDQGDYERAGELFAQLIEGGAQNGHLYYNLGNTYYRLGAKGKAMASYLEARRLLPRNPDVKANLQFLSEQLPDRLAVEKDGPAWAVLAFWTKSINLKEILTLTVALWMLGFIALICALWFKRVAFLKPLGLSLVGLAGCGFLAFGVSLALDERWGAVTAEKARVRSGPGEHNMVVFELREGAPFIAERQENNWYQIELSDGKKGWISQQEALVWARI